jgi:hypothetical protein
MASKFERHHVSGLLHPPNSPNISRCDLCLFRMLKRVLKDREFDLRDEIEEAITKVWDELSFEELQSIFYN